MRVERNYFPPAIHLIPKIFLFVSFYILFMLYRPVLFLGIGLLAHLFMDYCYVKLYRLKTS